MVENETTFSDVADGKRYTNAVVWEAANEIVAGYPDDTSATTLSPKWTATRARLAFQHMRQ